MTTKTETIEGTVAEYVTAVIGHSAFGGFGLAGH